MALPIFAITLFVSAFLLFLVQPMIGRMILPSLGGTPQVWNTCMVFFQTALLAGYAYTHTVSTRLKLRTQLMVHGALLGLPLLVFLFSYMTFMPEAVEVTEAQPAPAWAPFYASIKEWIPPAGANPIVATLLLLTVVVGLPFFVVSTSAPLLQKWFGATGHPAARDPYFLYGASNLGSMLSLVFYPFIFEPALGLAGQGWSWLVGYFLLLVCYGVCVSLVLQGRPTTELPEERPAEPKPAEPKAEKKPETGIKAKGPAGGLSSKIRKGAKQQKGRPIARPTEQPAPLSPAVVHTGPRAEDVTPWRRIRWVLLTAVPSSLMLGITTYISTDVSAIPLFWIIPLALYLLSWILVFTRWPVAWVGQPHSLMVVVQPIVLICFAVILMLGGVNPIWRAIALCILTFFLVTMVCHGEMAKDRPTTKHLTEYYLWMSVGGMLGGVFNAIVAPVVFTQGLVELYIALVAACLLRPRSSSLAPVDQPVRLVFLAVMAGVGLVFGYTVLTDLLPTLVACLLGMAAGVTVGMGLFNETQANGWTEELLLSLFPGLGRWADEKGKELREEAPPQESAADKKKAARKPAGPPDYYLLNYAMDFALPALVFLYLVLAYAYQGHPSDPARNQLHGAGVTGLLETLGRDFLSMDAEKARDLAPYGFRVVVFGLPLFFALLYSFRPLRFGLAIGAVFLVNGWNAEAGSPLNPTLHRGRSYFGVLSVQMQYGPRVTEAEAAVLNASPPFLFAAPAPGQGDMEQLGRGVLPKSVAKAFTEHGHPLGEEARVFPREPGKTWEVVEAKTQQGFQVELVDADGDKLDVSKLSDAKGAQLYVSDLALAETYPPYTYLMHGTTHHGLNYQAPRALRRQPTTYYHRLGPVGAIYNRFDWFSPRLPELMPGQVKTEEKESYEKMLIRSMMTYPADAHLPVSVAAAGAAAPLAALPVAQLGALWSEPTYATIGLGTGTMAAYGRPFQHVTFYEIDDQIRSFSLNNHKWPELKEFPMVSGQEAPYYNYLRDAIDRGVGLEVVMGDARLSMKPAVETEREEERQQAMDELPPEEWQHRWKDLRSGVADQHRQHYYHAIVVDAFSSDAIPVHLITKEAIQQYFAKLVPGGVLLVHTSNRHVELIDPVADIARDLNLEQRVARGETPEESRGGRASTGAQRGLFTAEYVMLVRRIAKELRVGGDQRGDVQGTVTKVDVDNRKITLEVKNLGRKTVKKTYQTKDGPREVPVQVPEYWSADQTYEVEDGAKVVINGEAKSLGDIQEGATVDLFLRGSLPPDTPVDDLEGALIQWYTLKPPDNRLWTDDYSNLMKVFRWGFRH